MAYYWTMNELRIRSRKKSKSFWKQMKMNTQQPKTFRIHQTVLRGKFREIQAYLKKIETIQINNLTVHLQELEEQQQRQPTASRRKEMTKIRAELNNVETKRTILKINKSRSWFFEKIKSTSL